MLSFYQKSNMLTKSYTYVKRVLTLSINQSKKNHMKKFLLVLMMGLIVTSSFAKSEIGKKKRKSQQNTEIVSEVRPIDRQRWIERDGNNYVIVSRTTITKEDYLKLKGLQRQNH